MPSSKRLSDLILGPGKLNIAESVPVNLDLKLPIIDEFTSSSTWVKSSDAAWIEFLAIGPGGNGGNSGTLDGVGGGGGGGSGQLITVGFPAILVPDTLTVTVSLPGSNTTVDGTNFQITADRGSNGSSSSTISGASGGGGGSTTHWPNIVGTDGGDGGNGAAVSPAFDGGLGIGYIALAFSTTGGTGGSTGTPNGTGGSAGVGYGAGGGGAGGYGSTSFGGGGGGGANGYGNVALAAAGDTGAGAGASGGGGAKGYVVIVTWRTT